MTFVLHRCNKFTRLPPSLGSLSRLQQLTLFVGRLEVLPESFGSLHSLKRLDLMYAHSLKSLPESFGALVTLTHLSLKGCKSLPHVPDSFSSLRIQILITSELCPAVAADLFNGMSSLRELHLEDCNLERWPHGIEMMCSVEKLMREYRSFEQLPDALRSMSSLTQLRLRRCNGLKRLRDDFDCLSSLQRLDLSDCPQLLSLPPSFGNLSSLDAETFKLPDAKLAGQLRQPVQSAAARPVWFR